MLIFGERHGVVGQVFWSLLISKKKDEKKGNGKGKTPDRQQQHQQQRKPDGMNNQPMNKQPYAIHVSGNMFAVISTGSFGVE